MTTLALISLLVAPAPLKVGETWTTLRRARWVNEEEEIDYLQEDRYRFEVVAVDQSKATVKITRKLLATELAGTRVAATGEGDNSWTQVVSLTAPAVLADPEARDQAEVRLGQLSIFWLPQPGSSKIADWGDRKPGPADVRVAQVGDSYTIQVTADGLRASGTSKREAKATGLKLTAPSQYLPTSGFRGTLTVTLDVVR